VMSHAALGDDIDAESLHAIEFVSRV